MNIFSCLLPVMNIFINLDDQCFYHRKTCSDQPLFNLQLENPTKGDRASNCKTDLKELQIDEILEEIRNMKKRMFKQILKEKVKKNASEYILKKGK